MGAEIAGMILVGVVVPIAITALICWAKNGEAPDAPSLRLRMEGRYEREMPGAPLRYVQRMSMY